LGVEVAGGLVEHENARPARQHAGEAHASLFANAERCGARWRISGDSPTLASASRTIASSCCASQPNCCGPNATSSKTVGQKKLIVWILKEQPDLAPHVAHVVARDSVRRRSEPRRLTSPDDRPAAGR
jgi:hypothetical protein